MEGLEINFNKILADLINKALPKDIPDLWAIIITILFFTFLYIKTDNEWLKALIIIVYGIIIIVLSHIKNKGNFFKDNQIINLEKKIK